MSEEERAEARAFLKRWFRRFWLVALVAILGPALLSSTASIACKDRTDPARKLAACDRAIFFTRNLWRSTPLYVERAAALEKLGRSEEAVRAFGEGLVVAMGGKRSESRDKRRRLLGFAELVESRYGADEAVMRDFKAAIRHAPQEEIRRELAAYLPKPSAPAKP